MATAPQHAGRARRWTARGLLISAIAAPVLAVGITQAHAADLEAVDDLTSSGAEATGVDAVNDMEESMDDSYDADDPSDTE
jgi:hypothetical protein